MQEMPRTIIYWLMFIAVGLISGVLGPSLIYLSTLVQASVAEISVVFTARAMGNMLGAVIAGRMYDRVRGHSYLVLMLLLAFCSMWLVPYSTSLYVLLLVFFVVGFAEVSINTGGNLMILWLHKDKAGSAVVLLHLCFSLGNMLAPLVLIFGGWLGDDYGMGYWLIALYTLIFPLLLWRQASPVYERPVSTKASQPFNKVFFGCFLSMAFLYVGFEITIAGWISTYAVLGGMTQTHAAVLVTWFFVALSFGRLISVPVLTLMSLTQTMLTLLCLCFFGTVVMLMTSLPLIAVALLLGLGCSAIFPLLFTFGNQAMSLTGKLTGYIFVCCGLGAMVVPSLTGPLIERFGAQIYPFILCLLSVALFMAWLNLLRLKKSLAY